MEKKAERFAKIEVFNENTHTFMRFLAFSAYQVSVAHNERRDVICERVLLVFKLLTDILLEGM